METAYPKFVIFVVYQAKNKNWRGFCSPYDVTTEAYTKEKALSKLKSLVELYEEGLKKYRYPKSLTIKQLSDKEDRKVLTIALNKVMDDMRKKIREEYLKFQARQNKEEIYIKNPSTLISYYPPAYCYN